MATATLRKLVTHYASNMLPIIDDLTRESGILRTAPIIMSNNGTFHKYKKTDALPTAAIRNVGGTYTVQTVNNRINQIELKEFGITQSEDRKICDDIGKVEYFIQERPAIMEALGQKISTSIVYGTNATYGDGASFLGWHDICNAHGSNYYTACGASTSSTSIFVVRFKPNVNGIVINSKSMQAGEFIKMMPVADGNLTFEYGGSAGTVKPVYQILYTADLAFLASTVYSVHALYGVDDSTNAPTDIELKKAIDSVKGKSEDTIIYTSRMGKRAIETLNASDVQTTPTTDDYSTVIQRYAGIPVIVDDNILETEATANLPY